jgi:hypothetical protein
MIKPPYPLHPEPMKKSWIERNPLWKIPLGMVLLALLLAVYGTIVAAVVTGSIRHSKPYQQAMAVAAVNPQVRERMGEPIHADWLVAGDLHVDGSTGRANFRIPITGPRGGGRIRVEAYKSGDIWTFTCLQVEVRGRGDSINLLTGLSE